MAIPRTRMHGFVGLIRAVIVLLGSVAVAATIVGFFGGTWWLFDLAADYRFPLMVTLVAVAIAYGLGYGRGAAVIFLIAAVVNAVLIVPLWISQQPKARTEDNLRVVTFDVEGNVDNREEILSWLGSVGARIVFLQGTDDGWATDISAAGFPYRILVTPGDAPSGTTVLARADVNATLAPGGDVAPYVEIVTTLGGATLTLIGVDTEIPRSSGEADTRLELFSAVADRVAAVETRVAVVGNLSTTRWSHAYRVLASDPPLRASEDGAGYWATWNAFPSFDVPVVQRVLGLPLDHVLLSEDLTTTARTVGPDLGPNHRGVVVDIARAGN
jgi:endonuclease/exonuclease/phosphatase (EEP) superfamily protein YafD